MISSLKMVFPLLFLVILGCDWVVTNWLEMTLRISWKTKDSRTYQRYLCQKKLKWGNWIGCHIKIWIRTIGAWIRIRRCQGAGSLGVLVAYGIHFSTLLVSHYLWNIFHTIYNLLYSSLYQLLCTLSEPLPLKDIPHYLQTTLLLIVLTLVYFKWSIILERFSTQFANNFIGHDNNSYALLVSHHLR